MFVYMYSVNTIPYDYNAQDNVRIENFSQNDENCDNNKILIRKKVFSLNLKLFTHFAIANESLIILEKRINKLQFIFKFKHLVSLK